MPILKDAIYQCQHKEKSIIVIVPSTKPDINYVESLPKKDSQLCNPTMIAKSKIFAVGIMIVLFEYLLTIIIEITAQNIYNNGEIIQPPTFPIRITINLKKKNSTSRNKQIAIYYCKFFY